MVRELAEIYKMRTFSFEFACNLVCDASNKPRKLDIGEKVFIMGAVRDALLIPYRYRSEGFDVMLKQMLSIGVCDYTHIPPGVDKVVDYFYKNPSDVTDEFNNL